MKEGRLLFVLFVCCVVSPKLHTVPLLLHSWNCWKALDEEEGVNQVSFIMLNNFIQKFGCTFYMVRIPSE